MSCDNNVIYSTFGNVLSINFTNKKTGEFVDVSAALRFVIVVGDTTIDSQVTPAVFVLTQANIGIVGVMLGNLGIAKGTYAIRVVVHDVLAPSGIVWAHEKDKTSLAVTVV